MADLAVSWRDGPMVALDFETTGKDPCTDRIVSAAVVVISSRPPGERRGITRKIWLADPGMDIPADATAIHGITTEQVRREGQPGADVAAEVSAFLGEVWTATTPLCVFKADFDLTMLNAELQRHHGRSLALSGPVIDPLCIDRHLDPHSDRKRTLHAMCDFYQVQRGKAHDAEQDALAVARLAWRLAEKARIASLALHELHSHQAQWYCDQARDRAYARSWPLLPLTSAGPQPARRQRPARPGGPANSHASWTPDRDAALREEWLAADAGEDAKTLRCDVASRHGRSPGAIRSRLLLLKCDPELPGRTCDETRAAHLKQIYAAEYGGS